MAPKWMDLGLALGLDKSVLELIKSNYRYVSRCLTETLAEWLQQVRTARSWRAIAHSLIVPSISEGSLAHKIAMSHGMFRLAFRFLSFFFFNSHFACSFHTGIASSEESNTRYQDISSERLGKHKSQSASELTSCFINLIPAQCYC